MTKTFEVTTIIAALRKARDELHTRAMSITEDNFDDLTTVQALAILDLVDECTEPGEAMVGVTGLSSEEIRRDAYMIASKGLNHFLSSQEGIHSYAAQIADKIENGFGAEQATAATGNVSEDSVTLAIDVDTKVLDAAVDRLKSAQAAIDKSVASLDDILARQFERVQWRREAWNDCKAVMIREATEQLRRRMSRDTLYDFCDEEIRTIRAFIASFQFDESKP